MDIEQDAELRNPFPSPPSLYQNYTNRNLELLELFQSRVEGDISEADQATLLEDQDDLPDWPLTSLEKPRVDWVVESGSYQSFGETWNIDDKFPTVADAYGDQLYPLDPAADRRPALLSILRSLMLAYSRLMKALLRPPTILQNSSKHESEQQMGWISYLCFNMIGAVNELRPVQARLNLEALMKSQLQLRKAETESIHKTCDELEEKLASLVALAATKSAQPDAEMTNTEEPAVAASSSLSTIASTIPAISLTDAISWADSAM